MFMKSISEDLVIVSFIRIFGKNNEFILEDGFIQEGFISNEGGFEIFFLELDIIV